MNNRKNSASVTQKDMYSKPKGSVATSAKTSLATSVSMVLMSALSASAQNTDPVVDETPLKVLTLAGMLFAKKI